MKVSNMNFYLLDNNLNYLMIIENYRSFIWSNRYYTSGDFELYAPLTDALLNTVQRNYFIIRDDDLTQCMVVSNIEVKTSVTDGDYIIITGLSLKSILNRRIIWSQTVLDGNVETMVRKLVTENAIEPSNTARVIPNLILGDTIGVTATISAQYTGDNLGETISGICQTYRLGYDVKLDIDNKNFIFVLYEGADRTSAQSVNPRVIFSDDFDNLLTSDYTYNSSNYRNVVLVAGEGEGTARKTVTTGSASGLDRYELFVDARDVSSNDGEISSADYNKLLLERGSQKLAETIINENITGEVEATVNYKLGVDFFLGDLVEVVNAFGMIMAPRITEVIECSDENGYTCVPTFYQDEQNILTERGEPIITEDGERIILE